MGAGTAGAVDLVAEGRRLFTTETFLGNGRTCATCHRPDNDYTIDAAYIARLPPRDPLFVAEFEPALRGLDRPRLLRELALVTVHADGFDKPEVARAVPHLLGLGRSIAVEPSSLIPPGRDADVAAAIGWSGDGAPGSGSLREFAAGAVAQHFPKTLARRPGVDFRIPTDRELEALEAFLLSLGRAEDIDISDATGIGFASPLVERGRRLFNSEVSGSCAFCHDNGGALNEGGFNGAFDTGVERHPGAPALVIDPALPADGGFGAAPAIRLGSRTGFGDGRFSSPHAIEAADTAPLFHDNSAATIEDAVRFYTTPTFAESPEGQALPTIDLDEGDVVAIAALLRVTNALENIRNSNVLLRRAAATGPEDARELVRLASADTRDAAEVLAGGRVRLHPGAIALLQNALALERRALRPTAARRPPDTSLLWRSAALKERAAGMLVKSPRRDR